MNQSTIDKLMIVSVLLVTFSLTAYIFASLFWSSVSLQSTIFKALMSLQGAGH